MIFENIEHKKYFVKVKENKVDIKKLLNLKEEVF